MPPRYSGINRGQILIIAAIAMIVMLGFVGLAIDSGRGYGVKAKLNSAVDAAAIAGARALADGTTDDTRIVAARKAAKEFYIANFPANYLGADLVPLNDGNILVERNDSTGAWSVTVNGSAIVPATFMRLLGFDTHPVRATGATLRPPWDVVLVLDTSGSLGPPTSSADTLPKLQAAAVNFVNTFNSGSDLLGLVSFASGAVVDVAVKKDGSRGFTPTQVISAINALSVTGSTASAEGMRRALNELNAVPVANRSRLRAIVFFSDGAPNDVPASFNNGAVVGDLYSETESPGTLRAERVYRSDQRDSQLGTYSTIATLPANGFTVTGVVGGIPLASYNNKRVLGTPIANTRCNVNKAARNMLENVANMAREQKIYVYSIGLGTRVNSLEITFCGYGPAEQGSGILKRVANTTDSDTLVDTQRKGMYAWALDADSLDDAFMAIARAMIRVTK